MNLQPRWVGFLDTHGFAAAHWSAIGNPRAPDTEILKWAARNGHVVFTHDLDFGALLAATQTCSPSVIQVRADDTAPEAIGRFVVDSLQRYESELQMGALIVVEPARARVRLLPLG